MANQVLAEVGIDGLDSSQRDELTLAWERLPAWPDAQAGLRSLMAAFTVATLSNGNRAQQDALLRFTGLPFHLRISAEDFEHYKPDPEIYLGALTRLDLKPEQVMMVAAHKYDLRAAQAVGIRTAFVERRFEKGPVGAADSLRDSAFDIQATDFIDLADQLGTNS
jgi:2-haloacid dehalogenase